MVKYISKQATLCSGFMMKPITRQSENAYTNDGVAQAANQMLKVLRTPHSGPLLKTKERGGGGGVKRKQ